MYQVMGGGGFVGGGGGGGVGVRGVRVLCCCVINTIIFAVLSLSYMDTTFRHVSIQDDTLHSSLFKNTRRRTVARGATRTGDSISELYNLSELNRIESSTTAAPVAAYRMMLNTSLHVNETRRACAPSATIRWPSIATGGIFSFIYRWQHPELRNRKCSDEKFLVWTKAGDADTRNVGAWSTTYTVHLALAIRLNRILIHDAERLNLVDSPECKHTDQTSFECYFLPLSSCSLADVNGNASVYRLHDDTVPQEGLDAKLLYTKAVWSTQVDRTEAYGLGEVPRIAHDTAALGYFFRLQPWIREKVESTLCRSLPADLDPQRTLGMPIRGSDKCRGHRLKGSASGETTCVTWSARLRWLKNFVRFDPMINTLIITSEDPSIIEEAHQIFSNSSNRMLWDEVQLEQRRFRVIFNLDDVLPGTGSATQIEKQRDGANLTKAQVISSAMTSLHLQLRARYFILTSSSSWNVIIGIFARSTAYSFADDVIAVDIDKKPHAMATEMSRGDNARQAALNGNNHERWPLRFYKSEINLLTSSFPFEYAEKQVKDASFMKKRKKRKRKK